jgi:transglutaminase-like putative cysteine protease
MEFDLSSHDRNAEARLWIPYPVSDEHQSITNVEVKGDYAESAVYTDRTFKNTMLFARWDEGAENRKLTFSFEVERQEVVRRDLPEKEAPWDPGDYELYLGKTKLGPISGEVKELSDSITRGQTTLPGKARAIYDWVVDNMYRDPDTRGCGSGDVCELLKNPGGKCADISSVYIALARSAGVPAREILGIRLGRKDTEDITTWQHCWAEFYLPGYGWVPVDPADVLKMMLVYGLKLDDPEAIDYRNYFWGGVEEYRVALSQGRDLTLTPPQKGEPVNYLMYPFAQVGGNNLDWLAPETFSYTITYEKD